MSFDYLQTDDRDDLFSGLDHERTGLNRYAGIDNPNDIVLARNRICAAKLLLLPDASTIREVSKEGVLNTRYDNKRGKPTSSNAGGEINILHED